MEFKLLFQDNFFIAIDKPENILVHRTAISRQDSVFVLQELRNQIGQNVFPVHRLDRPTSGILLFGLDSETASQLARQFELREAKKTYWLICRGHPQEQGCIDHPISPRDDFRSKRKKQGLEPMVKTAKEALTDFRCLKSFELDNAVDKYPTSRYSLVEARPRTGRKHQLRRHFKHISHPIIGDHRYGKSTHNRFFAEHFGCDRLCLHACALEIKHPVSDETIKIDCPPSGKLAVTIEALGYTVSDQQAIFEVEPQ